MDAANGRVGIGTVSPTNKLVVVGTNAQPSALGTVSSNATLRVDGNSNHSLDFGTYTNSPYGSYISSHNKNATVGLPLVLNPVGGNVGVATNAPTERLDVGVGNVRVRTINSNIGSSADRPVVADNSGVLKTLSNPINTIFSMSSSSTYNLPSNAQFNAGNPQVLPFTDSDTQVNQGNSAVWDSTNNRYIINESGLYEIDALSYFGTTGTLSGSASWIGVNLGVTKNGIAATDLIATGRSNIPQSIANQGNTPIAFHCIVSLSAGDQIYLTMFRGASDNVSGGNVQSAPPSGLTECRHFSLKKL